MEDTATVVRAVNTAAARLLACSETMSAAADRLTVSLGVPGTRASVHKAMLCRKLSAWRGTAASFESLATALSAVQAVLIRGSSDQGLLSKLLCLGRRLDGQMQRELEDARDVLSVLKGVGHEGRLDPSTSTRPRTAENV